MMMNPFYPYFRLILVAIWAKHLK
jgi:hypothetical protein